MITLLLLVRATYMYGVVLHAHAIRGESHNQRNTTGEVATVHYVFGDESVKKLNLIISLSNNTVQRRIEEMSMNILPQVISEIRCSENGFAIHLDESIDVTNCAQLYLLDM